MKQLVMNLMIRICVTLLIVLLFILGGLVVSRQLMQQSVTSKAYAFIENGGVSELQEIVLGGLTQYIAVEGESLNQPVCLFLHGGPGLSLPYGISARSQKETITSQCTVVYWDQRGSGKTYSHNPSLGSFTYEELENDALELIDYLKQTYKQDKIYLIGYSWGSVLGMRLVSNYPELFYAYFGLSQVVNPRESEKDLYHWLLDELGDGERVALLKSLGEPPYVKRSSQIQFQELINQSNAYVKWSEGLPNVNILNWIRQAIASPDLTLMEVFETLFDASNQMLENSEYWQELQHVALNEEITEVSIPIYFATGSDDYICSIEQLTAWVDELKASEKELFILEQSAHYFSVEDEQRMYAWMMEKIKLQFPTLDEEDAETETELGSIISNLLQ